MYITKSVLTKTHYSAALNCTGVYKSMTKQESKLTLEELLNSMTTLDKSEYTPEERAAIANSEQVSYDEFLSHDLFKTL